MILQVENLTVQRGGVAVLAGVSFALDAGQAVFLRGPNGIGKTTLLRTLAGLQPAVTGAISGAHWPEGIAYASHADGVKPTLTVAENLRFWARVFGTVEIDAALDQMNLRDLKQRPAHTLSAGQKRRLGLARMLVTGRPIWVMDEPTISLDRDSTALFAQAVQNHLRGGGAAVIATHIDLGFDAQTLELAPFKAAPMSDADFDEAFL
ncbi:heme ABC exporter ATP-binding protein CcmA [Falsihalocynthiibacter arcticus]|uniref:Heme ABC transporter ATP-binding protein CcmA n=1 Tax=Falsihalocynthiibacter arcticus TaxID=1579316 RepID=A0A126V377_9RHOB|nr:heme ABC exporter ATP-binding protein CcmA [Falsihalocynthiibacter arcticus]AML52326.1 heme ABC transporter ATP-binding protein CcmA [Falsihalocynthiibacter arcticus]